MRPPVLFRESLKAALTIPTMYPALDTLEALVTSDLEWGVRSFGGWPDWFKDSKVRVGIDIPCALFSW